MSQTFTPSTPESNRSVSLASQLLLSSTLDYPLRHLGHHPCLYEEAVRMVKSDASTVDSYLAELPAERREALEAVREVILANLPQGYEECMVFGMIGYVIPLSRYPKTYNKQPLALAALASQKRHMAVYLNNVYGDPETLEWFTSAYEASGKRLDMGKSCVRFTKIANLPLELIGETIARTSVDDFLSFYEEARSKAKRG